MTVATIEQEVKDAAREAAMKFVMPKPARGQAIVWYPHGVKDCNSEVAFVLQVGTRNIILSRASGVCEESVRHIDDPKLQFSAEQRESGAWDFTDHDKTQISHSQQIADLLARVTELETLFNEPKKK